MKIGFHKLTHVPDYPVYLSGYPRDAKTSQIHIAPEISCLVLNFGNRTLAFCTIDTILVSRELVHEIRMHVARSSYLHYEDIHISATHTHSAPCIYQMNIPDPPINPEWISITRDRSISVILKSLEAMKDGDCFFSKISIDGVYGNRNGNPALENKEAYIFSFYNENQLMGRWINLSCHNTVNSTDNIITSDLFGGIRKQMESETEFCVITNGISGDISTRYYREGTDCQEVDRLSKIMADQLMKAPRGVRIPDTTIYSDLVCTHAYQDIQNNEHIHKQIQALEEKQRTGKFENWDDFTLESYYIRQAVGTFYHFIESSVMILDHLIFITLPGEAVTFFDQYLRNHFPAYQLIFLGTTDGYVGYLVPEEDQFDFEAEMAEVKVSDVWTHMNRIIQHIRNIISTSCGNSQSTQSF